MRCKACDSSFEVKEKESELCPTCISTDERLYLDEDCHMYAHENISEGETSLIDYDY